MHIEINFRFDILIFLTFISCFCIHCLSYGEGANTPGDAVEVTVAQGTLAGSSYTSRNGTLYYRFLSIPFAKPPIGDLRFEPPQPPESWTGIRDATIPPPACIQKDTFIVTVKSTVTGAEDCLYLNVFTPVKKSSPLPVMVYIHGGAYFVGNVADYEPSYFMDHPVVVVMIQYRLGILGFLSTGDNAVPGNNGMKDQVAALKWVQKNIANFGGDPNQVTIFGESAGASSVYFHLHSKMSAGLFHRAISQSGSGLAPWATIPSLEARHKSLAVGVLNGCFRRSTQEMVNCLKKVPAKDIVESFKKFYVWKQEPVIPFPIVDEPNVDGAFLTENCWNHNDVTNKVPWIIGINAADGCVMSMRYLHNNGEMARDFNLIYKRLFPITFYYGSWLKDEARISNITESLKNYYFGDKNIGVDTAEALFNIFTDGYFAYDSLETAYRYTGKAPLYFYYYDHQNEQTFQNLFGSFNTKFGPCHADDLLSLFKMPYFREITHGDDLSVSKRLVKHWVNFAHSGNPNDDSNGLWKPVESKDRLEYLHITTKGDKMEKGLLHDRYSFWKALLLELNHKPDNSAPVSKKEEL